MNLRPSFQRRLFMGSLIAGPLSLLVAVVTLVVVVTSRQPPIGDVNKLIGAYARAEFFAHNFLLVSLGGDTKNSDRLGEMSSATLEKVTLNPDPMLVADINVTDVENTPAGAESEWAFTMAASTVPPGGTLTRNHYRVTFVEKNGAYQAITLPRIVNPELVPIKVATLYTAPVDLNGVLGKNVANFAKAYLVSGDSGSLGRYASEKFSGGPIVNSPYTAVQVTSITAAGDADPAAAEAGTTMEILATVKTSISLTTYTFMQLPLRVSKTPNGQWLVDAITEPVDFGEVSVR